jgi:hypothetical protein
VGGKHSRNKGHGFERDIAIRLRDIFPNVCRQLEYQEGLGVDLANTGVLRIQCKAYKNYAPLSKIEEAGDTGIPALVTKGDRKPILIALRLDDFISIINDPSVIHGVKNDREEESAS